MKKAQRALASVPILLAMGFVCGAVVVDDEPKRCRTDALDSGTALRTRSARR